MTKWITETESILTAFGLPYDFERFSCALDQLPDTYIVYFLVDDAGNAWSDNKETSHEPRIQVSLFYRDKSKVLTIPDQIEAAFIAAFFMRVGSGTIPHQINTGHHGWRCDFRYYERR